MDKVAMLNEIRYAERLCARTARFYRRMQTISYFMAIVGGSATLAALAKNFPSWLPIVGALVLTAVGAYSVSVRPSEKAAANDLDARKYASLRTRATDLSDVDLARELARARESDVAEIELLRDVAWNDVVTESGNADRVVPLRLSQWALAKLA